MAFEVSYQYARNVGGGGPQAGIIVRQFSIDRIDIRAAMRSSRLADKVDASHIFWLVEFHIKNPDQEGV
jgi:hypothetical protein